MFELIFRVLQMGEWKLKDVKSLSLNYTANE